MLIYGSRMYFKKNVVRSFGQCEHCGGYTKKRSYQARKFGHLYFIPILPLGSHSQVLRECKSCNMGAHIPSQQLEPMIDSLSDQFKSWIVAITEGETEIRVEPDSPPTNAGVLIAGILDDLYCLKEIENVESITAVLDVNNLTYERDVVMGRWFELQGDLDQASNAFQAATRARPRDGVAYYQLGLVEVMRGDTPAAEEAFQQYSRIHPEDHSAQLELLGLYETNRDYEKLVPTFDYLFEHIPELLEQKRFKKLYKKACKKSGLQGKFSTQV
jgi:tetratricopeptide (TPR) repeat protein